MALFIVTLIPLQFAHVFFFFIGLDKEGADYAQYYINAQVIGICHVLTYNFELGIKAPPIATAIYLFNQFIILHLYVKLFVKDEKVQQAWFMPSKSSFNVNGLIEFLRIGIPSIGVLCLDWWSFEIMMIFASGLSVQAVAVQVLINTTGLSFWMIHFGI